MAQSTSARNKLDTASLAALLDAAQADPSLRSLRLRHVGLTPNFAVQLADFLETNRSITALDLTGNAIGSHGASCIATSLQLNNTIEQLTLAGCGLTSDAVVPFVACFTGRANMALRSMDLSNNQIDDDAAEALAALVGAMRSREAEAEEETPLVIDLRKNRLGDDAMRALATAMQTNTRLMAVRVECNWDEHATIAKQQIAFCAQRNRVWRERRGLVRHIQTLSNASCPLYDCHLQHIELTLSDAELLSEALRMNRSLVSLTLRDNALPVEATRRILRSLETHPSLRELRIQDNALGDAGFADLSKLLRRSCSIRSIAVVHSIHATPPHRLAHLTLASLHHTLARDALPLRNITLTGCRLGDLEISVLASGIAWAGRLQSLELRNNGFSDRSAHVLARVVHRCRRLQTLDVTGNVLTLGGALILAQAAASHKALQRLLLGRFPQYEAAVVHAIVSCLQQSETLVHVELATKERASRCADDVLVLQNAWAVRREAADRERKHHATQRRLHYEKHARHRARVRHVAVQAVTLWIHRHRTHPAPTTLE